MAARMTPPCCSGRIRQPFRGTGGSGGYDHEQVRQPVQQVVLNVVGEEVDLPVPIGDRPRGVDGGVGRQAEHAQLILHDPLGQNEEIVNDG